MADLGIKIDESMIKGLVAEGILAQLGDEAREKILTQAVVHLLTPPKVDAYARYKPPAPIQQAFNDAAEATVRDIVREMVDADPGFRDTIREAVGASVRAAMADGPALAEKISEAVGRVIFEGWSARRDYE